MNQKAIEILGDYPEFYTLQAQRLQEPGIDIDGLEVSHLAFRTETLAEYLVVRQKLESISSANVENAWNGRPISKLLLQEPLQLSRSATTSLIEVYQHPFPGKNTVRTRKYTTLTKRWPNFWHVTSLIVPITRK